MITEWRLTLKVDIDNAKGEKRGAELDRPIAEIKSNENVNIGIM